MYPDHTARLIRITAIFYSTFSNSLAILLAISDTTADQTAPSNQGVHETLFCRHGFKQTRNINTVMIRS